MIPVIRFNEFFLELKAEVNETVSKQISNVICSPTEQHLIKKLKDSNGLILAVKMPDSDSNIENSDNFSEANHCIVFLIEKVDPGQYYDSNELAHYASIQETMRKLKELILTHGLNGNICGEETLSKNFRTEWEYQIYGGFNGLSISFDLKDFAL